jgi:hypothetical protein
MKLISVKPLDWAVLALAAASLVTLSLLVISGGGQGSQVKIKAEDTQYRYPLDAQRTLTFDGPIGETTVRIAEGNVEVLSDPGPQQICVRQGRISQAGQWLACLPNEVFIRIEGETAEGRVDAQVY